MTPKRGQPPKPPEKKRTAKKVLRYSQEELERLEAAHKVSESPRPFARWLADITLEEAERILSDKK